MVFTGQLSRAPWSHRGREPGEPGLHFITTGDKTWILLIDETYLHLVGAWELLWRWKALYRSNNTNYKKLAFDIKARRHWLDTWMMPQHMLNMASQMDTMAEGNKRGAPDEPKSLRLTKEFPEYGILNITETHRKGRILRKRKPVILLLFKIMHYLYALCISMWYNLLIKEIIHSLSNHTLKYPEAPFASQLTSQLPLCLWLVMTVQLLSTWLYWVLFILSSVLTITPHYIVQGTCIFLPGADAQQTSFSSI